MEKKIVDIFQQQKALITFVVASDPDFDTTVENIVALAESGADLVEVGIPFSDPVADGPVIMAGDLRAFEAGSTTVKIFEMLRRVRQRTDVPIVLLTYINPVFKFGYDAFFKEMAQTEIQGIIVPDVPLEEQGDLQKAADQYQRDLIQLIAPTSMARLPKLVENASGFLYVVSSLGTTGQRADFNNERLQDEIKQIRQVTHLPIAIGFGIHMPEQVAKLAPLADGIIIGSGVVDVIAQHGTSAPQYLREYATALKAGLHDV